MAESKLEESWARVHQAATANARISDEVLKTFPLQDRTVPTLLKRQAQKYGDREVFRCGGESWTYEHACELAALWAGMLSEHGVGRGDTVAIMCSNRPEIMKLILGCGWLGAIAVPINTASRGMQLQHILDNCGAKLCFLEDQFATALDTLDGAALALLDIYVIGEPTGVMLEGVRIQALPTPKQPIEPADLAPGDPFAILYTSGTTGLSKGVLCPHAQFFWWSVYTARQIGVVEGDVLHTTLPLFHVNALHGFFQALLFGATEVVATRFSVSRFWDDLVESKATITYLLGAMAPMLLSRPPSAIETMHNVRGALAPGVPENFHRELVQRSAMVLFDGFGSTESNAVIGTNHLTYRPGSMGVVKKGIEARVVDENDAPVADDTPGELLLRASDPFVFSSGYFNMANQTVQTWRNLWLHTGDRVVRSADGHFKFIDRLKDSIRRRGENISSFEVEQVLASHSAVSVAAVFAVDSELGEDEVMAVIALNDSEQVSEEELIRFCEGRMTYFSIPRFIEFTDDIPRTESGKVQKFKLRERGKNERTWDREAAGVVVRR